jgi:TonB family protein
MSFLVAVFLLQAAEAAMAVPTSNPATWISTDDYPPSAVRGHVEGTVEFRLDVGATGRPVGCTIVSTSGNAELDSATCKAFQTRATFNPGSAGRVFQHTMHWQLPADNVSQPEGTIVAQRSIDIAHDKMVGYDVKFDVLIGVDGKVEKCAVISETGARPNDPCISFPVGKMMGASFVRNGTPIKAVYHQHLSNNFTFPGQP